MTAAHLYRLDTNSDDAFKNCALATKTHSIQ